MACDYSIARAARTGGAAALANALQAARRRTLALLDAFSAGLGAGLAVPCRPELNPPLWEAGHVAWFYDFWIARNPERTLGTRCDPDRPRPEGRLAGADALYNSSTVPHDTRWRLTLPDLDATRTYLGASFDETLTLLKSEPDADAALYFYRLALFHEQMHAEAATYMAQTLGIALPSQLRPWERALPPAVGIAIPATRWSLGYREAGFAFDNELAGDEVELAAFEIDSAPVSWRRFVPAVEAGALAVPRYLRKSAGSWEAWRFGAWEALDPDVAAVHLTWHEADAWCHWAGRRLPTEGEWECAAAASGFSWGDAWEWTASRFAPYPGFTAHPYRDYSRFGFDEPRWVLKGASRATDPQLAHPKYRNYFAAERADVHTGFRSCRI